MMKSLRIEDYKNIKENIIKDARDLLRLKKLKKRNKWCCNEAIKYKILRDIKNLFEHKEGVYHKPVRVGNFWSYSYIEHKSKGDRKTLSVEIYFNKTWPYLKI